MIRSTMLTAAALAVVLLPSLVHSDKETLVIQIGREKQALDTLTFVMDYAKTPELEHPTGAKWSDLEKDSAWGDGNERHVRYRHWFHISMGSRKGYGTEYISFTKRGNSEPEFAAGVDFHFPGDTLILLGWQTVHLYYSEGLGNHSETRFVSGSQIYGTHDLFEKNNPDNLAFNQWALVLSRKKERPPFEKRTLASRKETLRIQIGKDKTILDTVVLWIDYGKFPEIARPGGGEWADVEKDSDWVDDKGWYFRYSHSFMASMGSRKGSGGQYIHYDMDSHKFNLEEPHYSANVSFSFPGDTTLQFTWDPAHMQDQPEIYPYHEHGFKSGSGGYGQVSMYTGKGGENLSQGQWALLLKREDGWAGFGAGGSTAIRPITQAGTASGWLFNFIPGTMMHVPPGAKGLRVLDIAGRLHWEAQDLTQGVPVMLPGHLPQKALRFHWIADPS